VDEVVEPLSAGGLQAYEALKAGAVSAVTNRFSAVYGARGGHFGAREREACRRDLAFHLDFLEPVLAFGAVEPMVDYLRWLRSVLASRAIPTEHLVLSLEWLGEALAEQMDAADGALLIAAISAARDGFLGRLEEPVARLAMPDSWPDATHFESALAGGSLREAMTIVNGCAERGCGWVEIEMHVIQPALYAIGEKWQKNQITVATEHIASAVAQSVMTMGFQRSSTRSTANSKRVLLACAEGNHHAMGLRMVADAFALDGWDVQYLGANVPAAALVRHAIESRVDLVCLSLSFAQQLKAVKEIISQLAEQLADKRPRVVVGGLAINRFSRLATLAGADAYGTDALAAVACGNEMSRG
jgi:methylmalonyl-CoA mutase cobalamin-binding domain/chain